MNVQGFEILVLDGMEETNQANAGIVFFMELWPHGLKAAGHPAEAITSMLVGGGFSVFLIRTRGLEKLTAEEAARLPIGPALFWKILVLR